MAIIIDGSTTIKYLTVDTSNVMKKGYVDNSILVYSADEEIYKDGVLKGATTTGFEQEDNKLLINAGKNNYWTTNPETGERYLVNVTDEKTGTVRFNFTNFVSVNVKGYVQTWARQADMHSKIGIDSASEYIINGGSWTPYYFDKTYNISSLTGNHSIVCYAYDKNTSDDVGYAPHNTIYITEIIAYT